MGRPAARRHRRARSSQMMRGGIPFSNAPGVAYEYSNYGFAILGRIVARRVGHAVHATTSPTHILKPLGHDVDDAGAGEVPPDRLAHGYRWEDEQWKEEPQLPDGAFGAMGGMLTSIRDLGRTSARSSPPGRRATARRPRPIRASSLREMQQIWRPRPTTASDATRAGRHAAERRRLRLRARASPRPATSATSSRTAAAARLRLADALAAGVRRRHHRVRQPDLHRVGRRR